MLRLITFSSAHPAITDGRTLPTREIVDLLLHGIGARPAPAPRTERSEIEDREVGVM
jgi:hypothetical protein